MQRITYILLSIAVLASCDENSCSDVEFCTEQFETILVSIKDQSGTDIVMDSTATFKNNNRVFTNISNDPFTPLHSVLTDAEMDEVDRSGTELTFKGWKDGQVVVEEPYVIGHDCCHIVKKVGPETITVTLD